ncbi:uncharacterized protein LOC101863267 [Aplysia californica]|uniref:Uncharacterized protein LOC101863267 n=1 Tax=Aplysia californica TaxID=6500 RepID=A0ABM1A020_APLCA|nr:uncharacterized protein LOC101863267 [Aplysia californica]
MPTFHASVYLFFLSLVGHLNISSSRIKNVNVTYESGSINGSNFHVSTLTADQYTSLFPSVEEIRSKNLKVIPVESSGLSGSVSGEDNETSTSNSRLVNTLGFGGNSADWSEDCNRETALSKDTVVSMMRRKRFVTETAVWTDEQFLKGDEQHENVGTSRITRDALSLSESVGEMLEIISKKETDDKEEKTNTKSFKPKIQKRFSNGEAETVSIASNTQSATPSTDPPQISNHDTNPPRSTRKTYASTDNNFLSYAFLNDQELHDLLSNENTGTADPTGDAKGAWLIFNNPQTHSTDNGTAEETMSNSRFLLLKLNNSQASVDESRMFLSKPSPLPDDKKVILESKGTLEGGAKVHIQFKKPNPKDSASSKDKHEFGRLIKTPYETFMEYHLDTQNLTTSIYVSDPVNPKEERIILETKCLKSVLKQDMVMQISFVLLPPQDEGSDEDGARRVVQKIYNLIVENQFSLKLNGNTLDVVHANDKTKTEVDKKPFCPRGVEIMVFDEEFQLLTVDGVRMMYVNNTNSYFGVGRFDVFFMVSGNDGNDGTEVLEMIKYAFVCVMPRILKTDCTRIDLAENEYQVLGDNKTITFEGNQYDVFSYVVKNETTGSIQICVPSSFHNKKEKAAPRFVAKDESCGKEFDGAVKAEGYITQVLGRVSIFALACVLVTYLIFSKLRNLPGVNTMNLTLALFLAEIIFVEGMTVDIPWLCTTVAICVHYTFLAAHFWMNVMSFDVYRTFVTSTPLRQMREKSKYLPRYALYAWGVPLIIVAFCVFVEFSSLFDFQIGYGPVLIGANDVLDNVTYFNYTDGTQQLDEGKGSEDEARDEGNSQGNSNSNSSNSAANETRYYYTSAHTYGQSAACWIHNPLAALTAFGALILLIFLVNCVFFIRTIISISRTAKLAKQSLGQRHSNSSIQKMTGRSDVMLYVRMSTVMGFTWFFGLSSAIMSSFLTKPYSRSECIVSHVQSFLFNIFNVSQGIFIFVAFVCNRRVFALYVRLLIRMKKYILRQSPKSKLFSLSSTLSSSQSTGISYTQSSSR